MDSNKAARSEGEQADHPRFHTRENACMAVFETYSADSVEVSIPHNVFFKF